tara:strand:+ start:5500 stop:6843 length:1344 start_codon:yes stop_codon:yes gene_type:complete
MSGKKKKKVAVITIGRWQPPHKGHDILLRDTCQLATNMHGEPFIWVSPSRTDSTYDDEEGEISERTVSDPLSVSQRLYYLDKMYPREKYPKLVFLTDIQGSIKMKLQEELESGTSRLEHPTRKKLSRPDNWWVMDMCNKHKYLSIMDSKLWERVKPVRNKSAKVEPGTEPLPSLQCLNWLKSRKFTEVVLLVGSDRVEAFKKYNEKTGNELFEQFKIEMSGKERGPAGNQELIDPKQVLTRTLTDESIGELSKIMDGLSISEAEQNIRAQKYSGTRTRTAARNGEVRNFIEAVQEGNMSLMDCYCMMNDIRTLGNSDNNTPGRELPISTDFFISKLTPGEKNSFEDELKQIEAPLSVERDNAQEEEYDDFNPFEHSDLTKEEGGTGFLGGKRKQKRKTRKKKRKKKRKTKKKKRKKNRKTKKREGGDKKTRRKTKRTKTKRKKKKKN